MCCVTLWLIINTTCWYSWYASAITICPLFLWHLFFGKWLNVTCTAAVVSVYGLLVCVTVWLLLCTICWFVWQCGGLCDSVVVTVYDLLVCVTVWLLLCTVCWFVCQCGGLWDSVVVCVTVWWFVWQYCGLCDSEVVCVPVKYWWNDLWPLLQSVWLVQ